MEGNPKLQLLTTHFFVSFTLRDNSLQMCAAGSGTILGCDVFVLMKS